MNKTIAFNEFEIRELIATLQKRFDELMSFAEKSTEDKERFEYKRTAYQVHSLMSRIKKL